jgi:hypothetical protein
MHPVPEAGQAVEAAQKAAAAAEAAEAAGQQSHALVLFARAISLYIAALKQTPPADRRAAALKLLVQPAHERAAHAR